MNLAEFAIRQRTFVAFFTVLCIIAGIASYFELGKLEDPTFTVKSAVVVTIYPGASAKEVEDHVTDKVETKLQEMATLKELRSLSKPGMSMIFVDLREDLTTADLPQEWDLLRRKVSDVKLQLPATAQISVVQDEFSEVYGMMFAMTSDGIPMAELKDNAQELQRRLKAIKGIKKIELHGVQQQVVNIELPEERLAQYQMSAAQVISQLQSQNAIYDAGRFKAGTERIRIEENSEFQSVEDIENFVIKGGVGELGTGLIRLGDIANITLEYLEPAMSISRYNGTNAITLAVSPVDGVNVVSLGDELRSTIAEYKQTLPMGVEIEDIAFQPYEVTKSINNFVSNLLESVLIVVVVLWVFMGVKSALIVGSSLVITILCTLIFMNAMDISLQRVSLGSFILALGMLVDNAIVIVDLFIVKLNKGIERTKAGIEAVKETSIPLLGATVIASMGTLPVFMSTTDAGEFALSVPQIMMSSLLFSWLVAVTVTVLMCWFWIKPQATSEEQKESAFMKGYRTGVSWMVDNPKKGLSTLIPVIALTVVLIPQLSVVFMPTSDRALVFLDYWLPNGSQIEQTSEEMRDIEQWLLAQPEVKDFTTFVGASAPRFSVTVEPEPFDPAYGQILINTVDFESIESLIERGDAWLKAEFPQAEPRFRKLKLATKDKFSLEARFSGPDTEVLKELSLQAQAIFEENPYTKYIRDDWRQQSKVLKPIINEEQARRAGINRTDIALALKRASEGLPISQLKIKDELIPIQVRSVDVTLGDLDSIPVQSLLGVHTVPLGQVVDGFEFEFEDSMIWRRDRVPTITAQAGVQGATVAIAREYSREAIESIELPDGYTMKWGGEYFDEQKTIWDTLSNLPTALLVMIIIMVAMFNGFKQPIIIFGTLPLAMTGVVGMLLLSGKPFGFMALVGVICLSGMIIKNGIVLMDQIELERANGATLSDAIKEATLNRTMAISMGALTTMLGMIPLMTDLLFDLMAASIIGGLAVATLLSLFVMPALYKLFYQGEEQQEQQDRVSTSSEEQSETINSVTEQA
ncbi:efflux RND transporter permease subunit [Vibrio agarivorans]|uniref:efflux RND transporter permease subunit n=1 Tax=Vibrio agarivorans TaxID=153622 RepID=UPI0025B62232|nr:efflux RND transporter permease subunit [Vibrio agarivorans]MDN3660204.1 efflux RND transporter permease subunit [Vibrio agarivorans]